MTATFSRLIATVVLLLVSTTAFSQIPNGDFEHWTGNSLDGWAVNNTPFYTTCTPTTSSHAGQYAIRGEAVQFFTTVMGPTIQSGVDARGFAYTGRPATFSGWYQFTPQSGDRFGVNVGLFKGGAEGIAVAIAAWAPSDAVSSWTQFTVPFVYQTGDTPDTCIVQIQIIGPGTGQDAIPHPGSIYLLDDISLGGTTSVPSGTVSSPTSYMLEQNYPNPFNPSTTIPYALPQRSHVSLTIHNLLGQQVAVAFAGEQAAGYHEVRFNAQGLASGIYFYRLQAGSFVQTRRFTLLR